MSDFSLNPAAHVIATFGGRDAVVEITGVDRTRVYRWTQPRDRGGTDGQIPQRHIPALLSAADDHGIPLTAADFFQQPEVTQ